MAGYASLFLLALCIACGLYCAAELAEEYSSIARKSTNYILISVFTLHVLLLFSGIPYPPLLSSFLCHLVYTTLLPSFPYVEPLSLPSLGSLGAVVWCHYTWFKYFHTTYVPILQVTGFFLIMIWLTPLVFFVSLSLPSDTLPVGVGGERVGQRKGGGSMFKGAMEMAMEIYNKWAGKRRTGGGSMGRKDGLGKYN